MLINTRKDVYIYKDGKWEHMKTIIRVERVLAGEQTFITLRS